MMYREVKCSERLPKKNKRVFFIADSDMGRKNDLLAGYYDEIGWVSYEANEDEVFYVKIWLDPVTKPSKLREALKRCMDCLMVIYKSAEQDGNHLLKDDEVTQSIIEANAALSTDSEGEEDKWISVSRKEDVNYYRCTDNKCTGSLWKRYKYCPECGAKINWIEKTNGIIPMG